MALNRRGFFATLAGALAATQLPKLEAPRPKLAFHPKAFELVMDPLMLNAEGVSLKAGDVLTIEGTYVRDCPSTQTLRHFTVTADITS